MKQEVKDPHEKSHGYFWYCYYEAVYFDLFDIQALNVTERTEVLTIWEKIPLKILLPRLWPDFMLGPIDGGKLHI